MRYIITLILILFMSIAKADISVPMYSTDVKHQYLGNVIFKSSPYGLLIYPHLKDLPPGMHGFHIHAKPSCADKAMAAGGHWDPKNTGKHLGPYSAKGHLGDLPALYVDHDGIANMPLLAPRIKLSEIKGHSLMIHQGGDNYSDQPKPLGGGGARIACGIIGASKF